MIAARVRCAAFTAGSWKAITPLLTASTPVSAVQPLANALSISHQPRAAVTGANGGGATTGMGEPPAANVLKSPITIIVSSETMNRYVGAMNTSPASRSPRRLIKVMTARMPRHNARVCGSSDGKAETSAPTPAEMPTATFRM